MSAILIIYLSVLLAYFMAKMQVNRDVPYMFIERPLVLGFYYNFCMVVSLYFEANLAALKSENLIAIYVVGFVFCIGVFILFYEFLKKIKIPSLRIGN